MRKKMAAVFLLLMFSSFTSLKAIDIKSWSSGVSQGDYFYYEMYGVFTSSDPNTVIEVPAFEQNNTDWVRIDIADVTGSVVHQVYTLKLKDRTETFELSTNLNPHNNDDFNISNLGVPICATNLDVGDPLPTVQLTVNKTVSVTYPEGGRELNLVSWNVSDDWGRCYFDKKAGMLVDLYRVHSYINPSSGVIIYKADVVKMSYSSLWEIAEPEDYEFLFHTF